MAEYKDDGEDPITIDLPPRPAIDYGMLKLVGRGLGRSLSMAFDLTFIAVRIGWVQEGTKSPRDLARRLVEEDVALQPRPRPVVRCRRGSRDRGPSFVVVNGVSRNHGTRWDLTDAAEILGYLPEDDAFASEHRAGTVDELSYRQTRGTKLTELFDRTTHQANRGSERCRRAMLVHAASE